MPNNILNITVPEGIRIDTIIDYRLNLNENKSRYTFLSNDIYVAFYNIIQHIFLRNT